MPIFAIGGIACIGKTTFIAKQNVPDALTDYTQLCRRYSVLTNKTGNSTIASIYSSLTAAIHAELNLRPDVVYVDRFHWEGAVFEAVFAATDDADLDARLAEIMPVLKEVYQRDQHAGALLIDTRADRHLRFLNSRGDHLGRQFNLEYIRRQNVVFSKIGEELGIPVVDVGNYNVETTPPPIVELLADGVMGVLERYN